MVYQDLMQLDSNKVIPKLKEQFFKDCLTNKTYGEREWELYGEMFDLRIEGKSVRLLLLEIAGGDEDYDFEHIFALGNIAAELIERVGKTCYLCTTIGKSVVMLVDEALLEEWRELLNLISLVFGQYYKLNMAAVISDAGGIHRLRHLYKAALALLPRRSNSASAGKFARDESGAHSDIILRMMSYAREHLDNEALTLTYLANEVFFMNADYLGKLFKKETGSRFSEYVMNLRIKEAKAWILSAESFHVVDIAEKLGFGNNPQYFSQVFKKMTGFTPTAYKKSYYKTQSAKGSGSR